MLKVCYSCGKERYMLSFENMCFSCKKKETLEKTQKQIKEGIENVDTGSMYYVICPYCGHALETCYGSEDFPELYEEGDHTITCPECDKDYIMETSVSYYYETRKKEDR